MSAILPVSALADDVAVGVLRSNGQGVFVNGSPAPASIAVFDGDFIETQKQAVARIEATGSSVNVDPETVLKFQADEIILDHGSLSVFTGRGLRVRVGCVTMTPVNPSMATTYEVLDRDGKVTVHATKSDVYIDAKSKNPKEAKNPSRSGREIVRESEQKSREEKCGAPATKWPKTPGQRSNEQSVGDRRRSGCHRWANHVGSCSRRRPDQSFLSGKEMSYSVTTAFTRLRG